MSIFNDKRIKYIALRQNRGLSAALNIAITEATGRFLARMDSDDIMEPWRLDDQIRFMLQGKFSIVGSAATKFGIEHGLISPPSTGFDIFDSILVNNPFIHPTVLIDRDAFGDTFRYDESFRCEEDYELWSRLVTPNNCANIPYSTLKYRVAQNSNANNPFKKQLKLLCLQRLAARFHLNGIAPLDALAELQISGIVSNYAYQALKRYAELSQAKGLPKLGWIHKRLLRSKSYFDFLGWFLYKKGDCVYRY